MYVDDYVALEKKGSRFIVVWFKIKKTKTKKNYKKFTCSKFSEAFGNNKILN